MVLDATCVPDSYTIGAVCEWAWKNSLTIDKLDIFAPPIWAMRLLHSDDRNSIIKINGENVVILPTAYGDVRVQTCKPTDDNDVARVELAGEVKILIKLNLPGYNL